MKRQQTSVWMRRFVLLLSVFMSGVGTPAAETGTDNASRDLSKEKPVFVNLVPRERAVLSAEVMSTVTRIHKELGEIFKAGEPLIELDSTVYAANRDKARAQVETARAQLESKQSLLVDGGVSTVEVEAARLNLATARANLILAQKEVDDCTLKAPYDGRVVRVLVNRYETVQPGQKLIEIVNDRVLRAQFLVPSAALKQIAKGASVSITVPEAELKVRGAITHIGAVVDPASSRVKVFAEIANPGRTIRAGMRGYLLLSEIGTGDG